jgi:type IX secretion system PorP/SprF family membrane protein
MYCMIRQIPENKKSFYRILRLLLIPIMCIILTSKISAQDMHFSIYNSSPLFLNPANTGNFTGDWRLAGNYRNQWMSIATPFQTGTISFDKQFYVLHQRINGGVLFIHDESGSAWLRSDKLFASLSYSKLLGTNLVSLGLQLGYVYRGISGNQTWPSQWDPQTGRIEPGNENDGPYAATSKSYLDINAGLLWKRSIKIFEPEAGFSFSHINSPNQSFFEGNESLPVRYLIHAGVKTKFNDKIYVLPTFLYMRQKAATETIFGANIGYNLVGKKSTVKEIFAGVQMRSGINNSDAFAIIAGATVGRIDFAIGYDINISGLSSATGNKGAFEISFVYKSISTVLNSYSIPCERL